MPHALLIGNSDGIGLAATRRLLDKNWNVTGVSRSASPVTDGNYSHHVINVGDGRYSGSLEAITAQAPLDLCIYLAGIGELLDPLDMGTEPEIIDVNLTGMVRTAAAVIPSMVKRGHGHFMGISSLADELLSAEAPSYHASKAGFTSYLESLALALKQRKVKVTNVRFGFVDTKMAKGDIKPLMMTVDKAVRHLEYCIAKKPVRHTAPRLAIPLIKFRKFMMKVAG